MLKTVRLDEGNWKKKKKKLQIYEKNISCPGAEKFKIVKIFIILK